MSVGIFGIWELVTNSIFLLIVFYIFNAPVYFAIKKTGQPKWLFLVINLPIISLFYLWYFSESKWKNTDENGILIHKKDAIHKL